MVKVYISLHRSCGVLKAKLPWSSNVRKVNVFKVNRLNIYLTAKILKKPDAKHILKTLFY
jgi:hypothetical protein